MAKVKSFGCQLQISKLTTLLEMSVKFNAVLSLSFCMVLVHYLFPGPLPGQKRAQTFSPKTPKKTHPNYCSPVSRSQYMFFTAQTMMPTGVLLFVSETSAMDEPGLVLKGQLQGKENKFWSNISHSLKSLNLGLPVIGKQHIKIMH